LVSWLVNGFVAQFIYPAELGI